MASNKDSVNCHDFTKCAICFEEFKSPKCLPCSHSFCQECLAAHITTSCESKKAPVGFCCPLCRDFIPVENFMVDCTVWVEQFPTNDKLGKVSKISEENFCEACYRDGDQIQAEKFCLSCKERLCNMCVKYHRRLLADAHKVVTFDDIKYSPVTVVLGNLCQKHKEKKIKYFCKTHSLPCCTTCAFTEHRKCADVETVAETAERFRVEEYGKLTDNMENLEKELMSIKEELEKNVSDIEEKSEKLTEEAEESYTKMQRHLEKLKNNYLDQLSRKTKESKTSLQENVIAVGDQLAYITQCRKSQKGLQEEREDALYVRQHHNNNRKYETLKEKHQQSKAAIKLLQLKSELDCDSFESSNFFGNLHLETLKDYCMPPKPVQVLPTVTTTPWQVIGPPKPTQTRKNGSYRYSLFQ